VFVANEAAVFTVLSGHTFTALVVIVIDHGATTPATCTGLSFGPAASMVAEPINMLTFDNKDLREMVISDSFTV
jgi:hypothetical protein